MRPVLILASCLMIPVLAPAEDLEDQPNPWIDFYTNRVAQYEVEIDGKRAAFDLRPQPLLSYTNPLRGRDQHGAMFVWTRDGRPELLGSIWSIDVPKDPTLRRTSHEVHSLSRSLLGVECPTLNDPSATRTNALEWMLQPAAKNSLPSLELTSPAQTSSRRMLQMRRIADALSAVTVDRKDGREQALRLMPTPLMRYRNEIGSVSDGAVFAFVLATDPELIVLIEAVRKAGAVGEGSWRIIPARFTGTEIRLRHEEKEIWRCKQIDYAKQSGPYRLRVGVSELPAE